MSKLVIIGLSSGGFAALLSAKKFNPAAEITVIDQKPFDLLHICGLPFAIDKTLLLRDLKHDIGAKRTGVKIVRGKATKINAGEKKVIVDNKYGVNYDFLIVATGASPLIPPLPGVNELLGKTVFTVYTLNDTSKLEKTLVKGKNAVVVGAGPIGLEVGIALKKRGLKVKVIEARNQILPKSLDEDMAAELERNLVESGIDFLLGKKVEKIEEKAIFVEGKKIKCDLVVLSVGVKPNVELVKQAGGEMGARGLKVNEYLQTSLENVFAVGDAIEVPNMINGKPITVGLANSAYLQGQLVAQNVFGAKKKYSGTSLTFVSVLGEIEVASAGFNKLFAESQGIEVVSGKVKGKNKHNWFPGAKDLLVKVLVDKKTRKIIGCQVIGKDALMRINVASTAIKAGLSVDEFVNVELAYCPPLSEVHDILLLAAELAIRKMDKNNNSGRIR